MMHKFLLIAGLADSLLNFRGPLIAALQEKGVEVHVAAPSVPKGSTIRDALEARGVFVHEVTLRRSGTNVWADFKTLVSLWVLMRRIRPTHVLGYTVKPVVYGGIAAWLARVPNRFALITGLGYAFQEGAGRRGLAIMVEGLYSVSLRCANKVFFQNTDDESLFRQRGIVSRGTASTVVNGSGVDVAYFSVAPLPSAISFLLIARLLGDKGVREYAQAAEILRKADPTLEFKIVGWLDDNPDAIAKAELDEWIRSGTINYLGRLADVRPAIADSTVYVLPSYREGTPRSVLEAMAMGRAVITTDAPGCRETVTHLQNGLLVPVKSVDALVQAMKIFVIDSSLAARMGSQGRRIAVEKYDVHKVNAIMIKEMGIK